MGLALAAPAMATAFAFSLAALVLIVSGSDPLVAFGEMLENGTRLETMVDTLNRATPLFLSGIAAAIGFRMNLFNIGVEGQYLMAAFFAAAAGGAVDLPPVLHVGLILVVAVTVGATYSGIAGVLKVTRGVNEVISTIMLNGIAVAGLLPFLVRALADDSGSANVPGTTEISESGRMPSLNGVVEIFTREIGKGRELSSVLLIAAAVGVLYHVFISRTRFGFDLRASGINPFAARVGGVPPQRMVLIAMLLSGAAAGLVGMFEVLSDKFKYDQSFVQGLGFGGIAVALLGRNHPIGIAIGAVLFGFLDASSGVLQVSGSASREIVVIIQGVILLAAVVAYEVVSRFREREEARMAALALQATPTTSNAGGAA
ncbi:MAG: ABC transporter permease [Actinomycetota bacterium]